MLGSLYAARLQAAGNQVTVLARGQRLGAIGVDVGYSDVGARQEVADYRQVAARLRPGRY